MSKIKLAAEIASIIASIIAITALFFQSGPPPPLTQPAPYILNQKYFFPDYGMHSIDPSSSPAIQNTAPLDKSPSPPAPTQQLDATHHVPLRGTVIDNDGNKVFKAEIELINNTVILQSTSDKNGEFLVESLPAGNYTITARKQGYQPGIVAGVTVTGGEITPVVITISRILKNPAS